MVTGAAHLRLPARHLQHDWKVLPLRFRKLADGVTGIWPIRLWCSRCDSVIDSITEDGEPNPDQHSECPFQVVREVLSS